MTAPVPTSLSLEPENEDALRHLRGLSAHSDVVEPLFKTVRGLPGADCYSPDYSRYAYVLAYVGDRIFAFAEGMHGLTLRIPPDAAPEAIAAGATASPIGGDWWLFSLFGEGGAIEGIDAWIAHAYAHALSSQRGAE